MYFDRLDEIYAMVQSNWHFDNLTQTGLTGSPRLHSKPRYLPILGVNRHKDYYASTSPYGAR